MACGADIAVDRVGKWQRALSCGAAALLPVARYGLMSQLDWALLASLRPGEAIAASESWVGYLAPSPVRVATG